MMNHVPTARHPDPLSEVFLALADPTRRAMLSALAHGDRTLTELAAPFAISLPAVTKHLRILERAGLVRRSRTAQRKPCTLQTQPLQQASHWLEQYRVEWEARLDRLDAFVMTMAREDSAAGAMAQSPLPATDPASALAGDPPPEQGEPS